MAGPRRGDESACAVAGRVNGTVSERVVLSIVVPAFNEADNLALLKERITEVMGALDIEWELILVDDGSTDGTAEVMRGLHSADSRVKALLLSRNFGHEAASTAGLDAAAGDAAILMDADLQDPPELIPTLVKRWREGFDVVSAQRAGRAGESMFKKGTAFVFYRLMNSLVRWDLPEDAGDFRLVSRPALDAFLRCRETNRFVRALVAWTGFRQTTVPFERASRHAGGTKYGPAKLFSLAITSITGFTTAPLRIATWTGLAVGSLAVLVLLILAVRTAMGMSAPAHAFWAASLWFLGGVQCIFIGVLGEYIGRAYFETQHRPLYLIRETLGLPSDDDR